MKLVIAAATVALAVAAASSANAATVVNSVQNGNLTTTNPIGSIIGIDVNSANTYDWNFTIGGSSPVDLIETQLQATNGTAQKVFFDLCSGAATSSTVCNSSTTNFLKLSPNEQGSSFGIWLSPGSYFVQLSPAGIATDGELVSGSLQLAAVPEPATWAMIILGLGLIGLAARRRRDALVPALA